MSEASKLFKDAGFEIKEIGMSVYEGFYITYQGELATITFIDNTKTVKVSLAGTDVDVSGLHEDLSNPIKVQKEELGWFDKKRRNKMNKYQKALKNVEDIFYGTHQGYINDVEDIKELVNKSIPMKPLHISLLTNPPKNIIVCGSCKLEIAKVHKYCSECGQKIDWSNHN